MAAQKRIEEEANVKEAEGSNEELGEEKEQKGGEPEPGEGTEPLTVTNSAGFVVPARLGANGGLLATGGNKGMPNPNAGAPKKLTRESLTDAAGKASEPYLKLRDDWLRKAQAYLDEGKIDAADKCQKAADRIQEGYLKYGIGSKVTHTLERAEWVRVSLDSLRYALEKEGIDEATASRVCVTANDRLSESLE